MSEAVGIEEYFAIQQFLFREARLLDERRYNDWLGLLADDCQYFVPTRDNVGQTRGQDRVPIEDELSPLGFFEDDKLTLLGRVLRLGTGTAWGENPPSRTRHIVTNVEVERGDEPNEWLVRSNVVVHRTRRENEANWFVGSRSDVLRGGEKSLQLARRRVVLDSNLLDAPNLSVFL